MRVRNTDAKAVPLWYRPTISIVDAAIYSEIGEKKLYELTEMENCPFVLWIGTRRLIKRKAFVEYLERQYSV